MNREKRAEEWAELYRTGRTLQQIADAYAVSRQRVHQVLKPFELPANIYQPERQVRLSSPRNGKRIWSVYVMAAPSDGDTTYFKIGISSDIIKRMCAVQTGCPIRITAIWAITTFNNGAAQDLETKMHALLFPFKSHGEWVAMKTSDPSHKKAMNEAFALGVRLCSQMAPARWRALQVPEMRSAVRQATQEATGRGILQGREVWSTHRAGLDNWPA